MIHKVLTGLLFNYPEFEDLVGINLYPIIIPMGEKFPSVVYSVVVSTPVRTKDEVVQNDIDFQLDVYATTYSKAHDIVQVLQDRLHRFEGEVNGVKSRIILTSFKDDGFIDDINIFRVVMDFTARIQLTN